VTVTPAAPATPGAPTRLLGALEELRNRLTQLRLPLDVPDAVPARRLRDEVGDQLDDYVLPRLRTIDAPLIAVIGGSTGAGKSTLLNSVVGADVSAPGVLRPTTRSPVLACHPSDRHWFDDDRVLPGLARTTGASADPGSLHLVESPALTAGLAMLDAPDIDSIVRKNRQLAAQLLAAGDLWLFVTTAARYADAVPWEFLRTAAERSTALAVVLDRVPAEASEEVAADLARLLAARGLGDAPLFTIAEVPLVGARLPEAVVEPVRRWLADLAGDAAARTAVVRRTLGGALDNLGTRVPVLAEAAEAQVTAVTALRRDAATAYAEALSAVARDTADGTLLRGEVLARWQEFVGTGEMLRSLEAQVGRLRDRITASLRGRPQPGNDLRDALESGLEALIRAHADAAAEHAEGIWHTRPGGAELLAGREREMSRASEDFAARTARAIREWQGGVLDLVREEGAERRSTARLLSYGVNGVGLLLMLAVFAQTAGLTGAEVGVAAGTSVLSQKILEAVFGDQAVRTLAARARASLMERVEALFAEEEQRFLGLVDNVGVDPEAAAALRSAAGSVRAAR